MANEIQVASITGLTVTVQLYDGLVAVGAPIPATEVGTTGQYIASVPALTPAAHYLLVGLAGGNVIGSGEMYWDGDYEYEVSLAMLQGLSPSDPMTVTPTTRVAGNINLQITGDGVTTTTVTKI